MPANETAIGERFVHKSCTGWCICELIWRWNCKELNFLGRIKIEKPLLLASKVLHLLPSPDSDALPSCHKGQRQSSACTITATCNYCHLARCLGLGDALINEAKVGDVRSSLDCGWLWSMRKACQACQDPVRFSDVRTLQLRLSRVTRVEAYSHGHRQTAAVEMISSLETGWERRRKKKSDLNKDG